MRGWPKDEQRAVFQSFSLTMHTLTLADYAASGTLTVETGRMSLFLARARVVPALIGARLYASFSGAAFRQLVLRLLAFSGVMLLGAAIPSLACVSEIVVRDPAGLDEGSTPYSTDPTIVVWPSRIETQRPVCSVDWRFR